MRVDERLLERVGDRLLDDEALGGDAALAVVDAARACAACAAACVDVGVGQHDEGIGAAQLEHGLLERRARGRGDLARRRRSLPVSVTARDAPGAAMTALDRARRRSAGW